jgi:flagellin-like hook-associated protein FlgL
VRSNLLSLQNTASLLDTTQTRLATGNKVNSALDNPTNYFTASGLNARASDLGNLLDGVSNAIQTIQAANDGITSITKLVESAQATANQAQQTSESVATAAAVAGSVSLTDPTGTVAAVETGSVDVRDTAGVPASATSTQAITDDVAATTGGGATGANLSTGLLTANGLTSGQSFDVTIGGVTKTFTLGGSATVVGDVTTLDASAATGSDLTNAINTAFGTTVASLDATNHTLKLTAAAGDSIAVADTASATSGAVAALGISDADPTSSAVAATTSLTVKIGSGSAQTVNLTGVTNKADYLSAVQAAIGSAGTASYDTNNKLKIVAANNTDSITVGGDTTHAGFNSTAYAAPGATNSIATGVAAKTLTLTVGTAAKSIDLTGVTDQASLLQAVNDGLGSAGSATIDATTGNLKITAGNTTDSITASGTAAADLGLSTTAVAPGAATNTTIIGTQAKTLSIKVGTTDHAVNLTAVTDQASLLSAINTGLNGAATASFDATTGKLNLTAANTTDSITVSGTAAGDLGLSTTTANANAAAANPARGALISQYNGLLDQIDQLTADASYNGNNLLGGTSAQLKVVFNENGSSSLTVTGKDASAAGLGLTKLGATDFDTNSSITGILSKLKVATDTLRTDASSFGSNLSIVQARQDFTKSLINTLQTGASNLTLADSNEEAANLLALQTRQSLSTKALSLASQSDQNVLRLLQ